MHHRSRSELDAALAGVRRAPAGAGTVELIVRRPAEEQREVLDVAELHPAEGLVGDMWSRRPSSRTPDRSPHPDMQVTLMSARAVAAVAGERERWPLAGDQLYVDLDLSGASLPPGTRLRVGTATVEVTSEPHTGCGKFARRFGVDALKFVNSPVGRELNLRGINARVVEGGTVRTGDAIVREPPGADSNRRPSA